jgi:hypothetical protein
MNSRFRHFRPVLRKVSKRSSATDMVSLFSSMVQMTAIFFNSFCPARNISSRINKSTHMHPIISSY